MKKRLNGLSLSEMLFVLAMSSILLAAIFPLFKLKIGTNGQDPYAITCAKAELAADPGSDSCLEAIKRCKYSQNKACETLGFYADHGSTNEQTAAKTILREVCDQGGQDACQYFIKSCQKDIANCNVSGSSDDLHYYLNMLVNDANNGRIKIEDIIKSYYNKGYANIVSEIDGTCCNPGFNTACRVNGVTSCKWAKRFNSSLDELDSCGDANGASIVLDDSGNIYVTGETGDGSVSSLVAMKLRTDGSIIWQKKYHSSDAAKNDLGYAIALDDGGNVYITGESGSASNTDVAVIKLDSDGGLVWQKRFKPNGSSGTDIGWGIAINDGNIYVTGQTYNGEIASANNDIFILKLDSNGGILWQRRFNASNTDSDDQGYGITLDDQENVYVSGYSDLDHLVMIKVNSSGTLQWAKRYHSDGDHNRGSIVIHDGNIYIPGTKEGWPNARNFTVVKMDLNGTVLWQKMYDATDHDQDYGKGIEVDSTGNIYVTGHSFTGANDAAILKLDSSGDIIWDKRFNATDDGEDIFQGIKLNQGMLNIVGYSHNGSSYDLLVVKMSTTQTADEIFTSYDYTLTTQAPFSTTDPNFVDSAPSFTSGNPGFTTNDPGFPGF
ncbi:MAG: hypothetical protein A2287_11075 [Candidatus Melainabacteria bacterium RIFOXYA12_FULL_32_12]|nr:MAG: hypothetical protein A2255_02890 [Candidatus Melainabacteria bacterium RIFOXYA2_FULL_32_9]OGI30487.1 MAG: hypothetical protein A2287_11075 [Candidatus Melainabacteria bacterium RIFOXYA12_FULL_32_12]